MSKFKSISSSILSDVTEDFVKVIFDAPYFKVNISICISNSLSVHKVELYYLKDGDESRKPLKIVEHGNFQLWEVILSETAIKYIQPISYRFKLTTSSGAFFWDASGGYKYQVDNRNNFKFFYQPSAPAWLSDAIFYHIYIDSFNTAYPSRHENLPWGSPTSHSQYEFYGGDLPGILEKIDYLVYLGVNTLVLTPIFKSSTNHRYDTEDHYVIDKKLGGEEGFNILAQECQQRNIRIILDGVFNHISSKNKWFQETQIEHSSLNRELFYFSKTYDNYESFWGDKNLPKLNFFSEKAKDFIYKGNNSVMRYWNSRGQIHGWRLDACCLLGRANGIDKNKELLEDIYLHTKSHDKEQYIFGEVPFDPSNITPFECLDGLTNYSGFYTPIVSWLCDDIDYDSEDLHNALVSFKALLGHQFTETSINFIGNHDKQRCFSLLKKDENKYHIAVTLLFTYLGIPCIYYGEEIALRNDRTQNDGRQSMDWLSDGGETLRLFRDLIYLRKRFAPLRDGSAKIIYDENNVLVFERIYLNEMAIIIVNNLSKNLKNIKVKTVSLQYLSVSKLFSYLDKDIEFSIYDETLSISEVKARTPIVLTSTNI